MDELSGHDKEKHQGTEVLAKQKQEYKFLGAGRRPHAGMVLFALDMDKAEVYRVKITDEEIFELALGSKDQQLSSKAHKKAHINPLHPMLWAINDENALRKFKKLKFRV